MEQTINIEETIKLMSVEEERNFYMYIERVGIESDEMEDFAIVPYIKEMVSEVKVGQETNDYDRVSFGVSSLENSFDEDVNNLVTTLTILGLKVTMKDRVQYYKEEEKTDLESNLKLFKDTYLSLVSSLSTFEEVNTMTQLIVNMEQRLQEEKDR